MPKHRKIILEIQIHDRSYEPSNPYLVTAVEASTDTEIHTAEGATLAAAVAALAPHLYSEEDPSPGRVRDAIAAVVNYMWASEEGDYCDQLPPDREGHIFEDLEVLQAALNRDNR